MVECVDVVFVVGMSGVVYFVVYVFYIVKECGGKVIEVNVERSGIILIVDVFIRGKVGEVMFEFLRWVKDIMVERNYYG